MDFVDRLLTCADCGGEFIFTAGHGPGGGGTLAHGDAHGVFGVRHCDDGSVQADAGAAGALPAMLQEQARAEYGHAGDGDGHVRAGGGCVERGCGGRAGAGFGPGFGGA